MKIKLFLVIAILILGFIYWQKNHVIEIRYSAIEQMYCVKNFCYQIEKADYQKQYCFSKTLFKTCLKRTDFEVIE